MAQDSKIEWTNHTVNLWWGCEKVHAGCDHCYAEYFSDVRYKNGLWGSDNRRLMRDQCEKMGIPYFFKQIDKVQTIPESLQIRQFA
jgi:protein gp37